MMIAQDESQDFVDSAENTLEGNQAQLTDWTNPPKLTDLKQHLEDSRTIHLTHMSKVNNWLDNFHVRGNARVKSPDGNSRIQPKLIRKQAEWRYPALSEPFLSAPDIFDVKPVSWADKDAAVQNSLVLNHQFNHQLGKVAFIDEFVRAAVEEGTVALKVGWITEEKDYDTEEPVVEFHHDPTYAPVMQHLDLMHATQPDQYKSTVPPEIQQAHQVSIQHGLPYRPRVTGTNTVTKKKLVKNQPTLEVCDFRNLVIDPTAKGVIDNANFIIHSFETSLSDLKKDGRYKNLDQIQVSNAAPLNDLDHHTESTEVYNSGFNLQDKPRTKIIVFEYWGTWDIHNTGVAVPIVAAWCGNVLIRMEENPYPDQKLPFVLVKYLPIRRTNYGEPDGALLEDNQKVVGALMRGMIDLMAKSANAQTGMRKDMLDATNRRKFEQGKDYEFNPSVNPAEGVFMHKFPEIPQSAPLMMQMQQQEAESMTGVRSFSEGVSGNSLGQVAAGVRGALDSASKREMGILRRMAEGLIEAGRKIIAMNAVFLSEEEVVRVTNDQFVTVKRDDLPGDFDLDLTISTAETDDAKAKELAFMLQTVGPNSDPALSQMILADICRLRKMPDLAHKIETYQPQPNPIAQQKAELELQLLQSEIQLNQAQAASYGANAQLHTAKASTEGVNTQLHAAKAVTETAKAQDIKAGTDQKNLAFVEQASGVHQERDLQKQHEGALQDAHKAIIQHHLDSKLQAEAPQKAASSK